MTQKDEDKLLEAKAKLKNYAEELSLGEVAIEKGYALLENHKDRISSRSEPNSLAAGAVYISSILVGNRKTQEEICKVSKVSRGALRNYYKNLGERIDLDIIL